MPRRHLEIGGAAFFKGKMAESTEKHTENAQNCDKIVALSPKRERFCHEYVKSHNATDAAKQSGYSNHSAYSQGQRLLKNADIQSRIAQLEKPIAERLQLDTEWVLRKSKTVVERCMQEVPVMERVDGDMAQAIDPETGLGVWAFDSKGANGALQLIAKHVGGFNDRTVFSFEDSNRLGKLLGEIVLKYVPDEKVDECSKEIQAILSAKANE